MFHGHRHGHRIEPLGPVFPVFNTCQFNAVGKILEGKKGPLWVPLGRACVSLSALDIFPAIESNFPVRIVPKYLSAFDPPNDNVVQGTCGIQAGLTRHASPIAVPLFSVNQ